MPSTFQGTSFLITYPQSALTKDAIATFLASDSHISYYRIGRELHADGGYHFHAVVLFDTKQRFGARRFDCADEHPNITPVGRRKLDWDRVVAYVAKEDESPLEWGTPRHNGNVWSDILNAGTRDAALQLLAQEKPRELVVNRRNVDYFLDSLWPVQSHASLFIPRPVSDFVLPQPLSDWQLGNFEYVF